MDHRWRPTLAVLALAVASSACGDGRADDDSGSGIPSSTLTTLSGNGEDPGETGTEDNMSSSGDKLDTVSFSDMANGDGCPDASGNNGNGESFSYIWISNSPQGTVSKINTQTGIEEARYAAGPGIADPSRTSVNLLGDAVVVDRAGGIAKIAVTDERCVDTNNNGVIDTSQGPLDVRAWGSDECVLWHVPLPSGGTVTNQYGPRPVAWEGVGPDDCAKPRVWVGWRDASAGFFRRLNGETGAIEDAVSVPWPGDQWGPYGGATNKEGDFWVSGWQYGPLVRIDGDNLVAEVIQIPTPPNGGQQWTYGMALDAEGDPWVVGSSTVYHYDVATETWQFIDVPNANFRGMMIDAEGRGWAANNGSSLLVEIDTLTHSVAHPAVPLPGGVSPVGVSIDSDGMVWVVDQGASTAFKLDPDTYQTLLTVGGLVSPYTYSDMTGSGLGLVTFPPQG